METNRLSKVTIRTHSSETYAGTDPSNRIIYFSDGTGYNGLRNPTKEAAVIVHEYMHAVSETYNDLMQNDEADAMDESYSDYFGLAYKNQFVSSSLYHEYVDEPGGINYSRNLVNTHTFSEYGYIDTDGIGGTGKYDRSVIFSGALWDFRWDGDVNSSVADELVLESLNNLDNSPSFLDGRNALTTAAIASGYSSYQNDIKDAFATHRIPLLTAYIWGPGLVYPGQQNIWISGADGDLGGISHQWYIKYSGSSTWTYLGNSSNVTQTFYQSYQTHQLKLVINSNGQSAEDLYTLVVWGSGFKTSVDTKQTETEQVPEEFDLHHNYPNPFNPSTKIMYSLPEASSVSLVIYNLTGSEVTRWTMANDQAGYKSKIWNGTDVNGKRVPAGMYIYKLTARSLESNQVFTQSHKMVLMK